MFTVRSSVLPAVVAILAFLSASCSEDDSGGESPPTDCGTGVAPGTDSRLLRWPYLQSVTAASAIVAWGADVSTSSGEVRFSRGPDYGTIVPAENRTIPGDGVEIRLFHSALIDLKANTEYCYQVRADGTEIAGGLRFRTAPDRDDAPVDFFAFGDFGGGSTSQRVVRDRMMEHSADVDVWFTTGDNAYSQGDWDEVQKNVFEIYREMFLRIPFFPTMGNHDYGTNSGEPYLANFFLPENAWLEKARERYYSTDWGPIHFVGLDSEMSTYELVLGATDDMDDWLDADLAATNKPWKIVAFHKPPYSSDSDRTPDPFVRQYLVKLIEKHGVQLVLTGHDHFYERSHPILKDKMTPTVEGGVTYIVTGGGGKSLYDVDIGLDPLQAHAAKIYHFVLGRVEGCTLTLRAIDIDGNEFDSVVLNRCR